MQPQAPSHLRAARLALTLCLGFGILTVARASETDRVATLEAIHNLENPRNLTRPGPCGELGAYQFRESTWRTYTSAPFSTALDRSASDQVAARHYDWLKVRLEAAHLPATPYNIALAWNSGVRATITGRAPRAARDYAQRAANLAAVFRRTATVATAR